ncbi:MAG TPA: DUF1972 domain-containing protein [Candidatus Thermoplasmatota archaeon]|nr:DUF1972 domain-containing protein [Candidatus Thermoplasmatota archaeon]
MKIGIIGTRGIPNRYGGFEQCAEHLAPGLVSQGDDVVVYSPHDHPYQAERWRDVTIEHVWYPEKRLGSLGTMAYDRACIQKAIEQECDVVLSLGYTPASLFFGKLRRAGIPVVTNMDGMEWRRSKWSKGARAFIRWNEQMAARQSDVLIADNPGIQHYLKRTYGRTSHYVPYGADHVAGFGMEPIAGFPLGEFDLAIARMEPENNVELIVAGHIASSSDVPLVVVGGLGTPLGQELSSKFKDEARIRFVGSIFDQGRLNALRRTCRFYFHGHTVGGTNPSLIEAMAAGARVWVHENEFNRYVVGPWAPGFSTVNELADKLNGSAEIPWQRHHALARQRLGTEYSWSRVIAGYREALAEAVQRRPRPDRV